MLVSCMVQASQPNIALFYGANPPWDELHAFEVVVVEPLHVPDPKPFTNDKTTLIAYVSLGEVSSERSYLKEIPETWKLARNNDWGGTVIDQSRPGWPLFFVDHVIKPLWEAGYRGFFVDTLDSYQRIANTSTAKEEQEAGMVAVILELKKRYPQAKLIFNRGFEILPQVYQHVYAVAVESIFQGWNATKHVYQPVPELDRNWLLDQLKRVKQEYGLPVLAIDYVPPNMRDLARDTATKIHEMGFTPWVSNPEFNMLGVGEIEVMPRKVLMIQNTANSEFELINTSALHYGTMPLNYLGYSVEYLDARKPLPGFPLNGRYAGIVVWLDTAAGKESATLSSWLKKQIDSGVKVAIFGEAEFLFNSGDAKRLGLQYSMATENHTLLHIVQHDPLIGFETQPIFDRSAFFPLHVQSGKALLTLANDRGESQESVALTAWGGYALNPHVLIELPNISIDPRSKDTGRNLRWVINPIEFLRQALKLPDMPVPDVTTEGGRRMLMVHMDGDGFASKAEFPGSPYAAEVLRKEILQKYPLPVTMSVIQGEVSPNGLYPTQSADMEKIAREIFALPQVEIASHSYSHPFLWRQAQSNPESEGYHLVMPNYIFNLQKEISGSISYIDSRLAPLGKSVQTFLWTGDCNVGSDALELAQRSGVVSMNGGETLITRSYPTLTLVSPLGVPKGKYFQVYAPNQNENVYTNNWTGPYYGFERVIETFELTNTPYRLKPIDIYFHTYSASKVASLKSLDKVFSWATDQETTPVTVSDYVRKVLDFNNIVVSRTREGWLVSGANNLHELRAPISLGQPFIEGTGTVAGFNQNGVNQYLHLDDKEANIRFRKTASKAPYFVYANASIKHLVPDNGTSDRALRVVLKGLVPLKFSLAMNVHCSVRANGDLIKAKSRDNGVSHFSMQSDVIDELRILCPR
jgi:uncharacterized protein (TIGR01370 family)